MYPSVFRKKVGISVFVLCAFLQLGLMLFMVFTSISIVQNGTEYKFKLTAQDPYDVFRGKYLHLQYDNRATEYSSSPIVYKAGDTVYAQYRVAEDGFASLSLVETKRPSDTKDFLKITAREPYHYSERAVSRIPFPLTRWYMNEHKTQRAEQLYRESEEVYAIIFIRNGRARIKDIYFDGVSVEEVVEEEKDTYN